MLGALAMSSDIFQIGIGAAPLSWLVLRVARSCVALALAYTMIFQQPAYLRRRELWISILRLVIWSLFTMGPYLGVPPTQENRASRANPLVVVSLCCLLIGVFVVPGTVRPRARSWACAAGLHL